MLLYLDLPDFVLILKSKFFEKLYFIVVKAAPAVVVALVKLLIKFVVKLSSSSLSSRSLQVHVFFFSCFLPRFSYSDDFNSATVEPDDYERLRKEQKRTSRQQWLTKRGFVCPGKFTNDYKLHEARVAELKLPFRDNVLHGSLLKPTLPWRDSYESVLYKSC